MATICFDVGEANVKYSQTDKYIYHRVYILSIPFLAKLYLYAHDRVTLVERLMHLVEYTD